MRDDVTLEFMKRISANDLKPGQFLTGCDWSHWQAANNQLESDMSDYDFFIHKITEGISFKDKQCKRRIDQLVDNKPCIVYHFFNINYDGASQARHFITTVKEHFLGKRLGLCVDFEIQETDATINEYCKFLQTLKDEYGYTCITYCGDFSRCRKFSAVFNSALWIARWRNRKPETKCDFWQFTNTPYDLDLFFGTIPDISIYLQWIV